ncbi:hypothetical protein DVH24_036523 [Malus domestica]|uniref:Uncharacterized protein n=1 Tax=Malus domestica TaxID=3750 RepID=A0A498IJM8_MALDO|nr:hypothetical protein DVH24_036523 [Malus domestica]
MGKITVAVVAVEEVEEEEEVRYKKMHFLRYESIPTEREPFPFEEKKEEEEEMRLPCSLLVCCHSMGIPDRSLLDLIDKVKSWIYGGSSVLRVL